MEAATKICRTRPDGWFRKKICEINFAPEGYTCNLLYLGRAPTQAAATVIDQSSTSPIFHQWL